MCVKFQLSVSESSRDIKVIVLSAGLVTLQTRAWHIIDLDFTSQHQFPLLPLRGLDTLWVKVFGGGVFHFRVR